ncbi:MAG: O-antigen ligase family protein [Actinobacteria bacterium]|nr:O-antigen ligase family protein [Actinomycetota bacterium]
MWVAVAVAAVASVATGVALAGGASRTAVLLPVATAVGLGMAWLALARFELFVAAILLLRASLDTIKLSDTGTPGLDPAGVLSVAFMLAGGLWLLAQRASIRAPRSPLVRPLVAFTVAGSLSIAFSQDPLNAALDVVRLVTVVAILLVLNQLLLDQRKVNLVLGAVFASALVPLALGAYQLLSGHGLHHSGTFERVKATFVHPNPFAIYLTLLIVTGVAVYRYLPRWLGRAVLGLIACCVILLLFTYTRSAWLATIAGVLTVGLLQGRRAVAIMGLAIVVLLLTLPSTAARFQDLEQRTQASGTPANSLVWRFVYWKQALELNSNPAFGIGLSTVQEATTVEKEPHNDFIRVYVETGLVGLAAYLWFLAVMVRVAGRAIRFSARGLNRGIAVGFAASLVSFLLLSLVSNVITQLVILWYFATLAAAAVAVPRIVPEPAPARP